MSTVKQGDSVQVHYEGRFEDGDVFDSSAGRDPMEFEAGSEQLIPGFSNGVVGMAVGDTKTLTLPPAEAYGDHNPDGLKQVALSDLPDGVKVGDGLQAQAGEHTMQVMVAAIDGDEATIDANHPLAGKTLIFDVTLVAIAAAD